VTVLVVQE